jgi:uncharacterized protein with GYD domain
MTLTGKSIFEIRLTLDRGCHMPKYLFNAAYTVEGLKGLLKEGASSRKATITQLASSLGGTLETLYFGFGESDVYVIAELPNNETAAALSLAVTASGAAQVKTTVLMTVEEVDRATKQTVNYRPPGA